MNALLHAVLRFSDQHALLSPQTRLVVAVSGGPDSLCLLHLLHTGIAPRRGLQLHVAHLDHQLRTDSANDAQFVADTAQSWGLSVTLEAVDVAALARERRLGLEAAGRAARYEFLIRTARQFNAHAIALGHTADDQAETVMLRLLRGAGVSGLAAMRPSRPALATTIPDQPALRLIRPLLDTTRAQVEAYCAAHHLQPRMDPSNIEGPFLRNRMRDHILPLLKTYNPSITATLGRVARVCAVDADLLERLTDAAWEQVAQVLEGEVVLDRHQLMATHQAIQRRLVQRSFAALKPQAELGAHQIDLVLEAVMQQRQRIQLPDEVWLYQTDATLRMTTNAR